MDNVLNNIMSVSQAAEMWGISQSQIKRYCEAQKIAAVKLGGTWVLDKNQPNPKIK